MTNISFSVVGPPVIGQASQKPSPAPGLESQDAPSLSPLQAAPVLPETHATGVHVVRSGKREYRVTASGSGEPSGATPLLYTAQPRSVRYAWRGPVEDDAWIVFLVKRVRVQKALVDDFAVRQRDREAAAALVRVRGQPDHFGARGSDVVGALLLDLERGYARRDVNVGGVDHLLEPPPALLGVEHVEPRLQVCSRSSD